ncbi:MAG: hypothetical protein WB566_18075, partial [Terriglobales bacterium]
MADDFTFPSEAGPASPADSAAPSPAAGGSDFTFPSEKETPPPSPTFMGTLKSSLTGAPSSIYEAGKSALSDIWSGEEQRAQAAAANPSNVATDWMGTNFSGLAAAPLTPITNIGKAAAQAIAQPLTRGIQGAGTLAAHAVTNNPILPSREDVYKQVEPDVETALALATPRASPLRPPLALPSPPTAAPMGVTLSEGQATGDLSAIQREQGALGGTAGPAAQKRAQAFADQQRAQVDAAKDIVSRGLDPFNMEVASSPQEAGQFVSQGMQNTAAARKAGVTQAYEVAQALPGEIHAGVFEGMPQAIKGDLTLAPKPVTIDTGTTPYAAKMLDYLDNQIGHLKIQNKADPFGPPNPQNVTGVSLTGIDQWRKNLSAMRSDAYAASPPGKVTGDARAAQAVLNSFDERIDQAVNGGMFTGDPAAVGTWNNARAANADYQSTFGVRKDDPVSR